MATTPSKALSTNSPTASGRQPAGNGTYRTVSQAICKHSTAHCYAMQSVIVLLTNCAQSQQGRTSGLVHHYQNMISQLDASLGTRKRHVSLDFDTHSMASCHVCVAGLSEHHSVSTKRTLSCFATLQQCCVYMTDAMPEGIYQLESVTALTKPPSTKPAMVPPSAPQTGLLPQYGPSGFRFRRLSNKRYVQKQMAAPNGRVGSLEADCHADLQQRK